MSGSWFDPWFGPEIVADADADAEARVRFVRERVELGLRSVGYDLDEPAVRAALDRAMAVGLDPPGAGRDPSHLGDDPR